MRLPLSDRLLRRELSEPSRHSQIRGLYGDRQFVDDLDIVNELPGHEGCVNALSWSRSGSLLASGSDDTRVNIYSYLPDQSDAQFTRLTEIRTGHNENIFSVKFMPHSNDQKIVTCAGDGQVRIFDIERSLSTHVDHAKVFRCHTASVKRIVTEASPFYFMTCSEDGNVRQWDIRQSESFYPPKYRVRVRMDVPPPLISYAPYNIELYSLSCSPNQPHYIALGGTHLHCFLHDRRMLGRDKLKERAGKLSRSADSHQRSIAMADATRCVAKFAPFGQPKMNRNDSKHITACKLGLDNPNELIASWSGDHVYLFDILRDQDSSRKFVNGSQNPDGKDPTKKRKRLHGPDSPSSGSNSRTRTAAQAEAGATPDLNLVMELGNGDHIELPIFREFIRQRAEAAENLDEDSGTAHANRVKQVLNGYGRIHYAHDVERRHSDMVEILISSAKAFDKIEEYISQKTYPVTRSSSVVDYELKLRGDRGKVWRFVQAGGTIARVLLGYKQQPVPDLNARDIGLEPFDMIRPARREGSQSLDRHEQFGYDFIKTILLWLDSGVGAVLREFSPESQYAAAGTRRRFPVSRDAGVDALETQLMPYLLSLATDLPVKYPECGWTDVDDSLAPQTLFTSEKSAVQALNVAMKGAFTDLCDSDRKGDEAEEADPLESPEAVLNNREAAMFFWGYKVCVAVLHQAAIDVKFPFVVTAFGDLLDVVPREGSQPRVQRNLPSRFHQASSGATESAHDPLTAPTTSLEDSGSKTDDPSSSQNGEVEDSDDEVWENDKDVVFTPSDSDSEDGFYNQSISKLSAGKRARCTNHTRDYRGHCNVNTTKDVNFYGLQDEYIVSGSDCGNLFIWEKKTGRLVNILEGDREVVNVIQPHPYEPMLAVSGIDSTVKIFSPDGRARADAAAARRGVRAIDPSGFSSVRVHRHVWHVPGLGETDDEDDEDDEDRIAEYEAELALEEQEEMAAVAAHAYDEYLNADEDLREAAADATADAADAAATAGAESGGPRPGYGAAPAPAPAAPARDDNDDDDGAAMLVAPHGLRSRRKLHEEYRITVRNDMNRRAGSNLGSGMSRDVMSMLAARLGHEISADMEPGDLENCQMM